MLDVKFIKENLNEVKLAAKNRNRKVDFDRLLFLDEKKRNLQTLLDEKRAERNKLAKLADQSEEAREKGKKIKEEIKAKEEELVKFEQEYKEILSSVPNVPLRNIPVGIDEKSNSEVKRWGKIPHFNFKALDHLELAKRLDLVDFVRGVKVGGFRSYFLKNEAAQMELAVLFYTYQKLIKKGYVPLIAPTLVKEFTLFGSGQFPWGKEEVYRIEKEELYLAGTAEVPVTAFYSGEILEEKDLPQKFVAFSPCFRREAGSYGKDTKGLYRLHQFNKIEQVIVNQNNEESSLKLQEELLENAEEILQDLKLPYRVMLMCTGEMGEPQKKKYDIETWMPARGDFGETMSDSYMGEFQARRLNLRYRTKKGVIKYAHTLNNTAIASPRILIAIFENYQQADGTILVPEVLRGFLGKEKIGLK